MLLTVGRKQKGGESRLISFRLSVELINRLKSFASEHGITVTDALERGANLLMKRGIPREPKR